MAKWLVVGIGNILRGDDGVGPTLANRVAKWKLPDVVTREVHQLTPELASEIVAHQNVLFIDASVAPETDLISLEPAGSSHGWGHELEPDELLAYAALLGPTLPRAWLLPVHGSDFSFREGFSEEALASCAAAEATIRQLLLT